MIGKAVTYLKNVNAEMKKVSWPTREQLLESTWITLVLAMIMALFIFLADQIISRIINIIL